MALALVLEDRDKCRWQSLLLRRCSRVQLEQLVRLVCLVLLGKYVGMSCCKAFVQFTFFQSFSFHFFFRRFDRLHGVVQGVPSFLPPLRGAGCQELGEFLEPHVWDSVFWWVAGGMRHPVG